MPGFGIVPRKPEMVQVEVKYIEAKKEEARPPEASRPKQGIKNRLEPLFKIPPLASGASAVKVPSPFSGKQELFDKKKDIGAGARAFAKPALLKPDMGAVKKKITLVAPDDNPNLNKVSSPSYIGYFQLTREKVRRILYQRYSYTEEGEIYLSFIVASDGMIRDVRVDEERSSASPYLREIAIASVREASPFPPFPKDLEYPELSFNVVVSFEIE